MAKQIYGFYDQSTGKYYVVGTDGQARPASQPEASMIYLSGGSFTWSLGDAVSGYYDESDKQYYVIDTDGKRRPADSNEAAKIQTGGGNVDLRPQVAPTPTPTPDTGGQQQATPPAWQTQQSWWGTLFPTDTLQRTAYDLDPSFAWATATNKLGGNNWAPRYDWMARQQGRYHTVYGDENTRAQGTPQGNLSFADWIEMSAPRFQHDFDMMPASQKGYNSMFMPAGRSTF